MATAPTPATPLPTPVPSTSDPANFDTRADAFLGALPDFQTETDALAENAYDNAVFAETAATTATTQAGIATTQAGIATTQATNAAASAVSAAASAVTASGYAASLTGTSTTSLAIGMGAKNFTATTGRQWGVGQFLQAASDANPANYMHGQVTSYDDGTGALVLNVLNIGGSGTYADWTITLSAPKGDAGATGASGKLTRQRATGTTQACANGNDYLALNAAGVAFTAPTAADLVRFKVTPANRRRNNSIDFGADTYWGPVGTGTGVFTLDRAIPAEWEYSSTDAAWIMI